MKKIIVPMVALALVGCGEPKSIQEISKDILSADERGNVVQVTIKTPGLDAGHTDLYDASRIVADVGKFQAKKGRPEVEAIDFRIVMPGNNGTTTFDALNFRIATGKLERINWDEINNWKVLNLADVSAITKSGQILVLRYCQDKTSIDFTPDFCHSALSAPVATPVDGSIGWKLSDAKAWLQKLEFTQKNGEPFDGKTNIVGQSKTAVSQLLAHDEAVAEVSITAFLNKNDQQGSMKGVLQMAGTLGKAVPDLDNPLGWISAAMERGGDSIYLSGKVVTFSVKKDIGMIQMRVRPAAA